MVLIGFSRVLIGFSRVLIGFSRVLISFNKVYCKGLGRYIGGSTAAFVAHPQCWAFCWAVLRNCGGDVGQFGGSLGQFW